MQPFADLWRSETNTGRGRRAESRDRARDALMLCRDRTAIGRGVEGPCVVIPGFGVERRRHRQQRQQKHSDRTEEPDLQASKGNTGTEGDAAIRESAPAESVIFMKLYFAR